MEIGQKLKEARVAAGLTQEEVAEEICVSRQTVSNWETGKTFPDIFSVIKLSDLYAASLDDLLKGDQKMIEHLKESTDVVSSNKKLILAVLANIALIALLIALSVVVPGNQFFLVGVFCLVILSTAALLHQIIQKI